MAKSNGIKKSGGITSSYPQDCAGSHKLPDTMGKSMGGGVTNLSHSLSGASAVQRGPGGGGKKDD